MPGLSIDSTTFSSSSVVEKKDISDKHFRWESIQKFIFLANVYSNHAYNFDVFSKLHKFQVTICEFFVAQIIIGMPYMFMDGFIKQYTRRIDGFKFLNPLLRGITFGLLLQTAFMTLTQSEYLSDAIRYLAMAFRDDIPWAVCYAESKNSSCISLNEIIAKYRRKETTDIKFTAANYHYAKQFINPDRTMLTTRCFIMALVWITIFILSTAGDETLVKMYNFIFVFKVVSSLVIVTLLILTLGSEPSNAFKDIMSIESNLHLTQISTQVAYVYGVGFLGFYDFGTMSPYTMIDTAVVIFSMLSTLFAIVRSWIIRVLYLKLIKRVNLGRERVGPHYLFFAVLPLSTEFMRAHRMYAIYVYLNFVTTLTGYLTMQTLTMSRLLHTEFRTLKTMYIVGIICCLGFIGSLPWALQSPASAKIRSLMSGVTFAVLYLGFAKVALIMWVYGIERFSTDIQFWLGFRPTKYWRFCWAIMPIIFLVMLIYRIVFITAYRAGDQYGTFMWLGATFLLVTIFNIKSISKLLVRNNLASIFTANIRYGPPDPTDRLKRRHYSETIQLRYCKHNCQVIDEIIDCNHMPLLSSETGSIASIESLKDIYRAEGGGAGHMSIKHASLFDLAHHHF